MDNGQAGTSPELMARAFFTCHQPDNRQGETTWLYGIWRHNAKIRLTWKLRFLPNAGLKNLQCKAKKSTNHLRFHHGKPHQLNQDDHMDWNTRPTAGDLYRGRFDCPSPIWVLRELWQLRPQPLSDKNPESKQPCSKGSSLDPWGKRWEIPTHDPPGPHAS